MAVPILAKETVPDPQVPWHWCWMAWPGHIHAVGHSALRAIWHAKDRFFSASRTEWPGSEGHMGTIPSLGCFSGTPGKCWRLTHARDLFNHSIVQVSEAVLLMAVFKH